MKLLKIKAYDNVINKKLLVTSFILYVLFLIWAISLKFNDITPISDCIYTYSKINIIQRIIKGFEIFNFWSLFKDIDFFLNILIFIPLGIYFYYLIDNKKLQKGLIIAICFTLFFELIQSITLYGAFYIFDIIANILGYVLGYVLMEFIYKKLSNKLINSLMIVTILILFSIVVFAVINTILNIDIYNYDNYLK